MYEMWAACGEETQGKQIGLPIPLEHHAPRAPRNLHHITPAQHPYPVHEMHDTAPHPSTLSPRQPARGGS